MKQLRKILTYIMLFLTIVSICITPIYANSAEPPCLTVIVSSPAEDLTLSIRFADGNESNPVVLKKEQKAWEAYYRFFYHMSNYSKFYLEDATLIVNSTEKNFELKLPETSFDQYNNLLTLDLNTEKVVVGQSPYRTPLLVTMRVALTLIIEGLVFFLFGYRKKLSWIAFICINLITQGALNIALSGTNYNGYWIIAYVFYEIIIFIVESFAFASVLKEHKKDRAVSYALIANFASLILGGLLLGYLPM